MNYKNFLALALSTSFLAACGGGDGGNDASTTPTVSSITFPLTTAVANFINERKSSTIRVSGTASASGQNIPFTGSGTVSESTTPSTFEGRPALKKSQTTTGELEIVGTKVPIADSTAGYFDSNYQPLGNIGANSYCVSTVTTPIPVSAKVGDNGSWYTSSCYTSSAKQTRLGTSSVSYTLEPAGDSTALFKVVNRFTDSVGNSSSSSFSWQISASGGVTRIAESGILAVDGVTLNFVGTYQ